MRMINLAEPDIFERFGLELTIEQKLKVEEVARRFYIESGGHFGLNGLLYGLVRATPEDHSNLNCLCSLERQHHGGTTWHNGP